MHTHTRLKRSCAVPFVVFLILSLGPLRAMAKDTVVVFLGDSITEGVGVAKERAYPSLVEKMLIERGKKVRVINAGVSGSTSSSAPDRMKKLLLSRPDWVVLALGANDGLQGKSTEQMEKNLSAAIELASKQSVRVLLAGMKVPPNYGGDYGKKFEAVFEKISKKYPSVVYMPFLLSNVGGERELNQTDGIHPNERGHEVIAKNIADRLAKKL